ncbi:triose-phosphate isomerase [Rhodovibrionaceae bacterium A322]
MLKKLIAGNWKMNGDLASVENLAGALADKVSAAGSGLSCDLLVCPPAALLSAVAQRAKGSALAVGGQDCHQEASGAFTGDTSASLLREIGCSYVIVGHSERRQYHGETNAQVCAKAEAALEAGLTPIVCVGETEAEREEGRALDVIASQVKGSLPKGEPGSRCVVAYEPVWAIGTGKTATPEDVAEVHACLRAVLSELLDDATAAKIRLLYGGSVKPGNAAELLSTANVDGALVGGASLKVDDFWGIAENAG